MIRRKGLETNGNPTLRDRYTPYILLPSLKIRLRKGGYNVTILTIIRLIMGSTIKP